MTLGDRDRADKVQTLIDAGRVEDEPSAADRERVRARLGAALAATGGITASNTAAAEGGATTALQGAGTGFGVAKLIGYLGFAAALAAAAVMWVREPQPRSAAQAARAQNSLARQQLSAASSSSAARSMSARDGSSLAAPASALPTPGERGAEAAAVSPASADSNAIAAAPDRVGSPGGKRASVERRSRGDVASARETARRVVAFDWSAEKPGAAVTIASNSTPPTAAERQPTQAPALVAASEVAADTTSATRAATPSPELQPVTPPSAASANGSASAQAPPKSGQPATPPTASSAEGSTGTQTSQPTAAGARSLSGELALLDAAQRALASGDWSRALSQLDQHAARYPHGSLVPERTAARAVTLCRMQRRSAGLRELQRLAARAPSSPLLSWARAACEP